MKNSMFSDVEDVNIRNNNRAAVMANTFEDNVIGKRRVVSEGGALQVLAYFSRVPKEDKKSVYRRYKSILSERGFGEAGVV